MAKNINFEDNIFILNTKIRGISDLLLLDASSELFLDRTISDLEFIGSTINFLLESLSKNKHLVTRDEQIHNLNETNLVFLDVLSHMQNSSVSFSVIKFPEIEERIKALILSCNGQLKVIDDCIAEMDLNSMDTRVVTGEEMSELLKDM